MYIDNQWELIGTTTIDLSNYLQKSDISATSTLSTGTEIGSVTINGTTTTLYTKDSLEVIDIGTIELTENLALGLGFYVDSADTVTLTVPDLSKYIQPGVALKASFSYQNQIQGGPVFLLNQGTTVIPEGTFKDFAAIISYNSGNTNANTTSLIIHLLIGTSVNILGFSFLATASMLEQEQMRSDTYANTAYTLSISGPTITLSMNYDSSYDSTITLPIWDGTLD